MKKKKKEKGGIAAETVSKESQAQGKEKEGSKQEARREKEKRTEEEIQVVPVAAAILWADVEVGCDACDAASSSSFFFSSWNFRTASS